MPTDKETEALFRASTKIMLGNGNSAFFWNDLWLDQTQLKIAYPALYKHSKNCAVRNAILDNAWIHNIKPLPDEQVLVEYIHLWNRVMRIQLGDEPDTISWRWTNDGSYTAASAYQIQFQGRMRDTRSRKFGKSGSHQRLKLNAGNAIQGKLMTADRLALKGIPHNLTSSLCNCHPKTAVHLMAHCTFTATIDDGERFQHPFAPATEHSDYFSSELVERSLVKLSHSSTQGEMVSHSYAYLVDSLDREKCKDFKIHKTEPIGGVQSNGRWKTGSCNER